jgi:hypothetical protein
MAEQTQKDFSGGQCDLNVSLAPSNTTSLMLNCEADIEIGSAVSRLGTATIDAQLVAGVPILGLVQHVDQADSTKNKLFASIDDAVSATNADIWDLDGSPAVSLADDTKSLKAYFLNYAGDTLRLNGTDAVKAYNSASWVTTGGVFDLANMPAGYKYPKEFLDRVYLWGNATTPYRLYYSGLLTAGVVSWTSGQGYVDIEPEDNGGASTGLGKVPGYILIFKRRSMHRWNYVSAFPEAMVNIGAYSQESIVEGAGLCAFYSDSNENEKGFYITNGGRPQCISKNNNRPIKKWVDAISATAVVAGWATENAFAWSVGTITVDGETFTNAVLKYNRVLNQWTIRTYPMSFKCFAPYILSGVNTIIGGGDDGTVYRIDKTGVYSDASTTTTKGFSWKVRQQHQTYGTNLEKVLSDKVILRGKNLDSCAVVAYADEDLINPIQLNKGLWKKVLSLFGVGREVKGTTLAIEVRGESTSAPSILREIQVDITANNNYV